MARHTVPALLLLVSALMAASATVRAQVRGDAAESGLSGYVLAPDGTPVSGGSVLVQAPGFRGAASTTSIERTGRFRVVPTMPGAHQVVVTVTGLAPYRVSVTVPPSRTLRLPVIRLSPATYFRVRFVSASGEAITSPHLRRQSLEVSGIAIPDPPGDRSPDQVESDGTITVGPLPRGITTWVLDMPFVAQTRLPDLQVTGADTLVDRGTVVVQPGAVLHVDVVDETGAPMPQYEVFLEDVQSPSPLFFAPALTNEQGRATFDRLSEGRYRLRALVAGYCNTRPLALARVVAVSGSGTSRTRLVVSGRAMFRITSPLGPVRGTTVSVAPDSASAPAPPWLRTQSGRPPFVLPAGLAFGTQTSCVGRTDADGRVTLAQFPPGPARLEVLFRNSRYVRRVTVPNDRREIVVDTPEGLLPLRVTNALTNAPVAAAITWTGGGGRVEATATANGDALLESVGLTGGTLTLTARGYEPAEAQFPEPPGVHQDVALMPTPPTSLRAQVINTAGEPVPNAVVELVPANPMEVGQIAVTDAKGFVNFLDVLPGAIRLLVSADRFAAMTMPVSDDGRTGAVVTLAPGHRVIASLELAPEAGPHLVRVVNEAGASMDRFLDILSDRRIEPSGRVSLGPLAPGNYVVELHGSREPRRQRITIVDRDVSAVFR